MSRRPARCTQADLRRATAVAKEMGMAVEVAPDGTIRIVPAKAVDNLALPVEGGRRIVL